MKSITLLSVAVLLTGSVSIWAHEQHLPPVFAPIEDDPNLPRVLLLGDSISMGYTLAVREKFAGIANVHRAPENCGPTSRGLEKIEQWLGGRRWDVIHFNFGLHDLKYITDDGKLTAVTEGKIQIPLAKYRSNMTKLIRRLQKTNAKLIWCSTTPVPAGAKGRIAGDELKYNQVAKELITEFGADQFLVNDLHSFANERLEQIQRPANVHFTRDGSQLLADEVVAKINAALELEAAKPKTAIGYVYHDANNNLKFDPFEKPIPNVRVSNGREVVKTAADGKYELPVNNDTMLFVIKPRNWRTPLSEQQLPQFYYNHKPSGSPKLAFPGVAPTGPLPASVDFPLYPNKEPDQFKAILFGDPQPRNKTEVDYIAHDVIEDLVGTDASFGVTLGDIVFDNLKLFDTQANAIAVLGIPWYNVIGNHDINFDAKNDKQSDETFEKHFGPAYYSFDHGPVHFLVLDDVEWLVDENGRGKYRGGLGKEQIEFVKNDLAMIPEDQLLVILMHIPLNDVHDRQDLYRLIEKRPFCMSVSAHTHYMQHRFITDADGWRGPEPHHHVVNVTVSGSWWSGQKDERGIPHTTMADGAPNGYSIVSFDGKKYKLDFRAAGRPKDYQMAIYVADEIAEWDEESSTDVYVNVFNGSERSKVELRSDGGKWQRMEKVAVEDPAYKKMHSSETKLYEQLIKKGVPEAELWRKIGGPKLSSHIWKGNLIGPRQVGTTLVEVRATDMHGREHVGRRTVRVRPNRAVP